MNAAEIQEAVREAMEATNFCTKHTLYHGQKYASCTPEIRKMVKLTNQHRGNDLADERSNSDAAYANPQKKGRKV